MPISFLRANSVSHNPHIALNDLQDGIIALNKHVHHIHRLTHFRQPDQMHIHVIMHDLPHLSYYDTTHMHQCMFMFMCMFILFIKHKTLII